MRSPLNNTASPHHRLHCATYAGLSELTTHIGERKKPRDLACGLVVVPRLHCSHHLLVPDAVAELLHAPPKHRFFLCRHDQGGLVGD
jgi:hypothetical protein